MKSHQRRPHPSVVINQTFQLTPAHFAPAIPPAPKASVLTLLPQMKPALAAVKKFNQLVPNRVRYSAKLTRDDTILAIAVVALAHIEKIESLMRRDAEYCEREGINVAEYWNSLMMRPLNKP